jgi:hypothetical protein
MRERPSGPIRVAGFYANMYLKSLEYKTGVPTHRQGSLLNFGDEIWGQDLPISARCAENE